jgi:hypothetical protein
MIAAWDAAKRSIENITVKINPIVIDAKIFPLKVLPKNSC